MKLVTSRALFIFKTNLKIEKKNPTILLLKWSGFLTKQTLILSIKSEIIK